MLIGGLAVFRVPGGLDRFWGGRRRACVVGDGEGWRQGGRQFGVAPTASLRPSAERKQALNLASYLGVTHWLLRWFHGRFRRTKQSSRKFIESIFGFRAFVVFVFHRSIPTLCAKSTAVARSVPNQKAGHTATRSNRYTHQQVYSPDGFPRSTTSTDQPLTPPP